MASGLGAIILVLIIVKQDLSDAPPVNDPLHSDIAQLEQQASQLQASLTLVHQDSLSEIAETARMQAAVADIQTDMAREKRSIAQQQQALSSVTAAIEKAPVDQREDVVQMDQTGEENYVMGLRVEGRKILFLIDSSASMTDNTLIDIIRRKNTTDAEKKRGPKWQRTGRIIRWLLARTPAASQVAVVAYNTRAFMLGPAGWFSSRQEAEVRKVFQAFEKLVPTGATNMQAGLKVANAMHPTDIYLLTDGLPTAGDSRFSSLNPFSSCGGLLGRATTISGACRVKLFRQTLSESAPAQGVKVNVILLPIEGDPLASPRYWVWAATTGGLLISPALSWP